MSSRKRADRDEPFVFEEESKDLTFEKLVGKIDRSMKKTRTAASKPRAENRSHDTIQFEMEETYSLRSVRSRKEKKYSGLSRRRKKNGPSGKKPKLTPGFRADLELDLHGLTHDEAMKTLSGELESARRKKRKTLLIITGRGLNSEQPGGILRKAVWNWLEGRKTEENLSFRWAPPYLGGQGAIIVFFN